MIVTPAPAAIVLAAGASTRMGRPKALLEHRGRSFVACATLLAQQAGCAPIVVVTGAVDLTDQNLPAQLVHNDTWPQGQLGSLQRGLAALVDPAGVLVLTVDRPHLEVSTVVTLVAAFRTSPQFSWQPLHAGRRGHPVIYPRSLLGPLAALPVTADPRELLRAHEALRRTIAVDDPAIHDNLDSPGDLARLRLTSGTARGRWTCSASRPSTPTSTPRSGLLRLDLEHGKANEIGGVELDAFEALCDLLAADSEVTCLCTTSRRRSGRGTPIFISGANVSERVGWTDERVKLHVVRQREIMRRLRHAPLFTVVLTHGVTFGWGTEFVLTADYCLATPTARFALPETGLGILPGARGTAELASLVGPAQALRLGCTGEEIGADEAQRIGLVHETVADLDAGLERVTVLAQRLRSRSPTAVAAYKRGLLAALGRPEEERLALERAAYEQCIDTGEAAIGRAAFSARRASGDTPGEPPPPQWGPRRL